jgi:hypothetical protein
LKQARDRKKKIEKRCSNQSHGAADAYSDIGTPER